MSGNDLMLLFAESTVEAENERDIIILYALADKEVLAWIMIQIYMYM